ncbi:hypothetical protein SAMN04489740_3899 [Arthrobacter alpinus]|uniref:Uncharacterized protein n=1 Tax=Arthrobacter alpinus TaxID=656366 RepID=A0A1H5NPB5_9MICC|nr:hypothetical protein SAMN04489740_3899 [Arthrobacter alpinus]
MWSGVSTRTLPLDSAPSMGLLALTRGHLEFGLIEDVGYVSFVFIFLSTGMRLRSNSSMTHS